MKIQCRDKGQVFHFLINFLLNKIKMLTLASVKFNIICGKDKSIPINRRDSHGAVKSRYEAMTDLK